ncbi:hypothetical protein BJ741DRAFT_589912 [Chytriomyces cf. hyalinus JEL632]|nr:hypothetical protein BJ741DRAFT_589912 [Chytriomyces cf. hyalinus JEL632]
MPKQSLRCIRCTRQHKQCDGNSAGCRRCILSKSCCSYIPAKRIRLSCQRCASLHKRCDHAETCARCVRAGVSCVYNVPNMDVSVPTTTLPDNTRSTSPTLPELDSQASTPVVRFPTANNLNVLNADDCFNLPSFDQSDANSINFLLDSLPSSSSSSSSLHGGAFTTPNLPPTKNNINILPSFSEWGLIHSYLNSTDITVQRSSAYSILDRSHFIDTFFDQPPALWWIVCAFASFHNKNKAAALEYFNRAKELATAADHESSDTTTTPSTAAAQICTFKAVQALLLISRFARVLNNDILAAAFAKSAVDLFVTMDLQVPLDWSLGQVEERQRTLESMLLDSCV